MPSFNNEHSKNYLESKNCHTSQVGGVWSVIPWILLLGMIAFFAWFYMHTQNNKQAWQPPTAEQVTNDKSKNSSPVVTSYHDAVAVAAQSVVNIYTTQRVSQNPYMNDPILRRYFEFDGMPKQDDNATSLGSGVIVSADGYIVTNAHVIEKADEIIVGFNDGSKALAKLVGTDPESDLAVIQVEATELKPLAFRTNPILVGDVALAIGNPFGVGQTVTQGIISATGRSGLGMNTFEDFIQTDAAINPGNSGGALVDAHGKLVGINTMIFSRSGGSMGIGFAIPTSIVEQVMNALIENGKVSRGWLGIEVQSKLVDPTDLSPKKGVEVMRVMNGSPAQAGGLKVGDIIMNIDGVEMTDANGLVQYVSRKLPDTVLNTNILRNNEPMTIQITLAERPSQADLLAQTKKNNEANENLNQRFGDNMSEADRERLRQELLELFEQQAK